MTKNEKLLAATVVALIAALAFTLGQESSTAQRLDGELKAFEPAVASDQAALSARSDNVSDGSQQADFTSDPSLIPRCYYLDYCGFAKVQTKRTVEERGNERLIETSISFSETQKVDADQEEMGNLVWNSPVPVFAICSPQRPILIFREQSGAWLAEEFDLTMIPGVQQNNATLYLALCHGSSDNEVVGDPSKYGYSPLESGGRGQFTVESPRALYLAG